MSKSTEAIISAEAGAQMARRAVAKLIALHSIPSSMFGRKRTLRKQAERELRCAIRQRPTTRPTGEEVLLIQQHIAEALRQSFEAVPREPLPPQVEALIMRLRVAET